VPDTVSSPEIFSNLDAGPTSSWLVRTIGFGREGYYDSLVPAWPNNELSLQKERNRGQNQPTVRLDFETHKRSI